MLVVLNHIDEVPEDRRASMLADLQRLLDADGLAGVPLVATSATARARDPRAPQGRSRSGSPRSGPCAPG